jgi:5'-methylthioadenosine phosphorylase
MGGVHPDHRIGDVCIPNQIIDWTRSRQQTFFDGPDVVHVPFVEPFCSQLRGMLLVALKDTGASGHDGGTVAVFDGPRFSTRAESTLLRDLFRADLLSMTAMPEAILARELGICYATLAVVTDLDAFGEHTVDAHEVGEVMRRSLPLVGAIIGHTVQATVGAARCAQCSPPEGSPFAGPSAGRPIPERSPPSGTPSGR